VVELPEISETCRCGGSVKLVGELATDARLAAWRSNHRCMTPDEERFRDVPQRTGGGTVIGFQPYPWDHDTRPRIT
jgi:hypothetical protein